MNSPFSLFVRPQSIAVVGPSRTAGRAGHVRDQFPSKALLSVLHGNCRFKEGVRIFLETRGIPSYPSVDRAVRALSQGYRYDRYREDHGAR